MTTPTYKVFSYRIVHLQHFLKHAMISLQVVFQRRYRCYGGLSGIGSFLGSFGGLISFGSVSRWANQHHYKEMSSQKV